MLAVHSPDALRAAIGSEDVKALTAIPGIGQKVPNGSSWS
ncbi:MAG: hypothetical protein R2709_04150 [Marmoricola sp.]